MTNSIKPLIVEKLYNRWRKRVFANDNIVCEPSGDGYWSLKITRGEREAILTVSPSAYQNFDVQWLLKADDTMRYALKCLKGKDRKGE